MARIEGIRIKNYKVFKEITLGKLSSLQKADALKPLTVIIGKNWAPEGKKI